MQLPGHVKDKLCEDAERIEAIVNKMVARIQRHDHAQAENAKSYWAAHIKSALGDSYGGLKAGWRE